MKANTTTKKKAAPKKKVTRKTAPTTPKRDTTKKVRKVGSGRTKGSYSFINVKLTDLIETLPETSIVMVSRKWAEGLMALGITITGNPIKATTNIHNAMKKPVDVKIKNLKNADEDGIAQISLKTDL
jgi:hypothetical protein